MRAHRLRLKVECAPELVAGVRGVTPDCYPVTMVVPVLMAAVCLDVVLSHEADDVADFNDQVVAVVSDASDRGDSVPWALDLRAGKALVVMEEPQAVCHFLDERWPLSHLSKIAPRMSNRQTYCLGEHCPACSNLRIPRSTTIRVAHK
jgi:hypothetical protein